MVETCGWRAVNLGSHGDWLAHQALQQATDGSIEATDIINLPDQLVNKSVSQGFCFNILCVGETGLGKSTLDTLFNTKVEGEPATHTQPGVQLQSDTYDLQESNMGLKLPVVNMVGFRGQINKEDSYEPIVEFIEAQSEAYL
ncbi:hypothetical protein R6Z07M_011623 [Ovis aries]